MLTGFFILVLIGGTFAKLIFKLSHHTQFAASKHEEGKISHYTCPMHPHIHEDRPGNCPICQMKLVPVYEKTPESKESAGALPSVSISPERQQLIGIKTVSAQKKMAIKEIRTVGRVAFDPDLAIAQREYLEITKNAPSLRAAAQSRLRLLGMSEAEIDSLSKTKMTSNALYLPGSDDSVWVYASLYPGEFELIKPNTTVEISLASGSNQNFSGIVRSIDPVVDPLTRSVRARILGANAEGKLKPDSFVNVVVKVDLGPVITVPKSAVIDTGTRQVAFVALELGKFQSRELKIGEEIGDDLVIEAGIAEGERVVASSTFLVDSESQLKAAVSGMESKPTCPDGEAWDSGMSMCMSKIGM